MFKLDNARIILIEIGVVHDRTALKIVGINNFFLEVDATPLKLAELIIIELINWTRIDSKNVSLAKFLNIGIGKVICLEADFEFVAALRDDVLEPGIVAINW